MILEVFITIDPIRTIAATYGCMYEDLLHSLCWNALFSYDYIIDMYQIWNIQGPLLLTWINFNTNMDK